MTKPNRNQHYVPQYYLNNFSNNGHIYIYDIKNKKSFSNSISNIAYKKKFYNVDLDFFNKIIEGETFDEPDFIDKIINTHNEKILATFFNSFNKTRDRIISKNDTDVLSVIDFHSLIDFILVQAYRNPKISKLYNDVGKLVISEDKPFKNIEWNKFLRGMVLLILFNNLYYGRLTNFKERINEIFAHTINEVKLLKKLLTESQRTVLWNNTCVNFITSDCPMAFIRNNPKDIFTFVFIPINTKVGIQLMNRESESFGDFLFKKSEIVNIEESNVSLIKNYNQSIIEKANRFVYSIDGKFPDDIDDTPYIEEWNDE